MMTVEDLADKTRDAYSACRYNSWKACVKALRKEGYDDMQVEAILRSKTTRWAADHSKNSYGKASSVDLLNYVRQYETPQSIEQLTRETFEMV